MLFKGFHPMINHLHLAYVRVVHRGSYGSNLFRSAWQGYEPVLSQQIGLPNCSCLRNPFFYD